MRLVLLAVFLLFGVAGLTGCSSSSSADPKNAPPVENSGADKNAKPRIPDKKAP